MKRRLNIEKFSVEEEGMCDNCKNPKKDNLQPVKTNFTEANNLYQCQDCSGYLWDQYPNISGGLIHISDEEARNKM